MLRPAVCLGAPVRNLSSLAVASLMIARLLTAAEPAQFRPNILFIYTDDQSYRTVSCYAGAYESARTPQIDRLPERGVRFSSAYIGTWCMASRATVLTGRHPYGIESLRMTEPYPGCEYDPQQCPFWPRVFREHGYVTAQIGKWHMGTDAGFGRDWDFQKVWNHSKIRGKGGGYYSDQLIETNGGPGELTEGYSTDNYTGWAVDFIRGERPHPEKPWYLWLCYGAVHGPYTPAARHSQAEAAFQVEPPQDIYPERDGKPTYSRAREEWIPDPGSSGQPILKNGRRGLYGGTLSDWVRQYQQAVLAVDEGVGRLVAALEETGQINNTLVVFTSDQGFAWGQHGFTTKVAPYDANIRAPLIFSLPGTLPEGEVCRAPAGGVDLVPTFFAFAGIDLPWNMHGRNLTPFLQAPQNELPHSVLTILTGHYYGSDTNQIPANHTTAGVPWWVSLRQGRYKYIRTLVAGEIEELYDLDSDPDELANLVFDPRKQGLLLSLREATIAELRRTNAGLVDHLPPVGTDPR